MYTWSKESLQSSLWSVIRTEILNTQFCCCSFVGSGFPARFCLQISWGWFSRGMNAIFVQRGRRENDRILPERGDSEPIPRFHCCWKKNSNWQQKWIAWYSCTAQMTQRERCVEKESGDLISALQCSLIVNRQVQKLAQQTLVSSRILDREPRDFFFLLSCPGLIFCGYVYIGEQSRGTFLCYSSAF